MTSATSRPHPTPATRKPRSRSNCSSTSTRHYLGAYLLELGGADAIVFTGGIGENSLRIREGVCRDLGWFGIEMDPVKNVAGEGDRLLSSPASRVQIWAVATNEEIVVARQARDLLTGGE